MTSSLPEVDPQPVEGARTELLREREFGLMFTGHAVSTAGDRLVMVAMPFAVLTIPGAGLADVGIVLGASALSLAAFVLVGGVYADRLPRQRTMLASDLVRGAAQAVTAALLLTDTATVGRVVVLQVLYGAAEAFFRPAVLGLVPQLVRPDQLQPANATLGLADNVAMVAGPAAAGLLVATVGAGAAIAVDAATFLVSAVALALLRPRPVERAAPSRFAADLAAGWREVTSRTWLWSVLLAFSAYHALVLPALFVLGPAYAQDERGGAAAWGVISAGFGLGAVAGSLLALRWRPARPGVVLVLGLCAGATQAAVVVSPLPTLAVAGLEALAGVGVAVCFAVWDTALQREVPPHAQSRVSSFDYLASLTLMPVGYLLVGPLAAAYDEVPTAVAATVLSLAVSLAVAASRDVRRLGACVGHRAGAAPG